MHQPVQSFEPFLFYREGWDWHWWSFSRYQAATHRFREILREHVQSSERVVFPDLPMPGAWALRAAVLELGGAPDPRPRAQVEAAGINAASINAASIERAIRSPSAEREAIVLADLAEVDGGAELGAVRTVRTEHPEPGAARSTDTGESLGALELLPDSAASLQLLAGAIERESAAVTPAGERPIVVSGPSLRHLPTMASFEWAQRVGAATVMAPSERAWFDVVLWARPTHLVLEARLWRDWVRGLAGRRARRGLRRLRIVLLVGRVHDSGTGVSCDEERADGVAIGTPRQLPGVKVVALEDSPQPGRPPVGLGSPM